MTPPKSNCYTCIHRGNFEGSAHSCCERFPLDMRLKIGMMYMKGAEIALENKQTSEKIPTVKLDPHGVKNGWCDWPIQFDPVWVSDCFFYEEKESS